MKKNLLLHSILTLCVMLFTAMGFAQVVNTNSGFESWTGTSPDGWYGSKSNIGTANVLQVTSGAHSGNYACQLINTASSHKRFSTQAIHVDNGTQYVISFWVKGEGDIRVAMYDGRETGSGYSSYSAYHSINSTSYQLCTDTVEAANPTDAGEFILSVRNTNADGDHLIVDDATVTAIVNDDFVAEPTAAITGNLFSTDTYFASATVALSSTTEGASIYYTLDGTEPTDASTLYSSPITLTETTTLKAIATLNGNSSSVLTKTITIIDLDPLFFENFESNGLNQMTATNVSGTYTWTTASYNSNTYAYANAYNQGATETWLLTPAITPTNAGGVILSFSTAKNYNGPGLQVKYSTDYSGSGSPASATWTDITADCALSSGSWAWVESGDVEISGAAPVYIAWVYTSEASSAAGWEVDNIMVLAAAASVLDAPVFTPAAGTYADSVTFSITCANEGAEIRYTTDGSEPTEASTLYTAPVTLTTTTTVNAKAFMANWIASETATAVYTIVYEPVMIVTPLTLNFNSTQLTQTFTVSGAYLTNPVTLTSSDSHFTVTPATISEPNGTTTVTVAFDGTEPATGTITVASGTLSEQVTLTATAQLPAPVLDPATETSDEAITVTMSCTVADAAIHYTTDGTEPTESSAVYTTPLVFNTPGTYNVKAFAAKSGWENSTVTTGTYTINTPPSSDTIIYSVGFEDEEGFTASNVYNNTTVEFTGAEGEQWGTYYGTPSTNNHIAGAQSMQMRWYTSASENIGYTYTNFDLHNVTHVTFLANSSNGLNVKVSHSVDGGNTYSAGQVFTLGSTAQLFNYVVDEEGSFNFVRLKFSIELPETAPTATSRVIIDSLVVFGIPGMVPSTVATPVITPSTGFYYEPQTIAITCETEDAVIRYTTDGTEPTENSTLYSAPFQVTTNTTIMAKAWKTNMTPSFTATAEISFPAQVANIAAFKAAASNDPQQIMSDVTFVFRSGRYMFVEDNTAAMLIYDNSTPIITTTYNEGDVIEGGIFGRYIMYQGMVEMVPTHNALDATGTPATVTPANATITDIKTQYTDVYESKLVHLSDVEFISSTKFVQNGDTMAIYNRFNTVTTEISAGDVADVTGFVSYSTNYGYQIYPRGDEDIDIHPVVVMDTVATPEFFFQRDGEFYRMTLTCATEGASMYYTIDGTDPDENSYEYTDAVPLQLHVHYLIKAIAMKEGMVNSAIAEYDYNPVGIENYELRDNLSVYPNPAVNNVYVRAQNDNILIERVELFNTLGQLLRTTEVGGTMVEIPVGTLATGTYYAKVFTDKGVVTMPVIRK